MRTHGTGRLSAAYFRSFAISVFACCVVPATVVWQPRQVLTAATSTSAAYLKLADQGVLAAGKRANFIVLDANPLDDITNTRRIAAVYVNGLEVDRRALPIR